MKVKNHKLVGNDGKLVRYDDTPNKSSGTITPEYLIMHYTAGGSLAGAVSWFNNPAPKASAHLIIGHDGTIVQMGQFNQPLWHAGRSRYAGRTGFNGFSVGIELVNWGLLEGGAGQWKTWTGTSVSDDVVTIATHKLDSAPRGWEVYSQAQIDAAIDAANAICTEYDIDDSHLIGHDDVSGFRGKRDPGPAFDMGRFKAKVFGRSSDEDQSEGLFVVSAPNGLNLREGPGIEYPVRTVLGSGARVAFVQADHVWWLVSKVDSNGNEDETGWVHSRWLEAT